MIYFSALCRMNNLYPKGSPALTLFHATALANNGLISSRKKTGLSCFLLSLLLPMMAEHQVLDMYNFGRRCKN